MKVITIAHQKGGVGKTTLAINLAYCFAEGAKVAIVDADPQESAGSLSTLLTGIDIVSLDDLLAGNLSQYDLVLIDTPPYLSNWLDQFFALSDFVLIPTKAGVLDAMAIRATIELLEQSMRLKPALKAGIVFSMALPRTTLTDEVRELIESFGYSVPIHRAVITQRVSYTRSPVTGSVFGSDDERAKEEVLALASEILERINN